MYRYTDEIIHNEAIPELGLPTGSSLTQIISALVAKGVNVDKLLDKELFPATPAKTTDDITYKGQADTNQLGIEAQKLTGSALKVSVTRQDNAADVLYKVDDFELPEGASITSTVVNISGQKVNGRSQIVPNGKSRSMDVSVGYNMFPITIDARVVVATKTGEVELRKSTVLQANESASVNEEYEIIDRSAGQAGDIKLTNKIEQYEARLRKAESRLSAIEQKTAK